MRLRRRAFLQQVCLSLASLGISEAGLALAGSRYQQVLAQPTRRKLALLVGINQYPNQGKMPVLQGCLTDVDLQQELLIHRFGFQRSDILILEDQQATRDNIEAAFIEHLVGQAHLGDVVVFHFSGYGRHARLGSLQDDGTTDLSEQNTLVPVDSVSLKLNPLETLHEQEVPIINDLLEETLLLLLRSLQTDQVTSILDTSYNYPGSPFRGTLRVRSRPSSSMGQADQAELALQEQLLSQTQFSREQVGVQRRSRQMPGVILAASGPMQLAAEAQWHGFKAGLFTYALTQHLWSTTPAATIWTSLSQAITDVQKVAGEDQQPELSGQRSQQQPLLAYYLSPGVGADGVITAIEGRGKNIIWLAGLPAEILEQYRANSILTVLPLPSESMVESGRMKDEIPSSSLTLHPFAAGPSQHIQLRSVNGLVAKGQFLGDRELQVGQLVQEAIRVLPHNVNLAIALDTHLDRIERVDATSAFSAIPQVSTAIAGEKPADYLFAKVREVPSQNQPISGSEPALANDTSPPQSSYGLFSLGGQAIPSTANEVGEAVKLAVRRLTPKLQTLLATKLLSLTMNEHSSCLGVSASLETIAPESQVLMRQETSRAPWPLPQPSTDDMSSEQEFGEASGESAEPLTQAATPARTTTDSLTKAERDGTLLTLPIGSRIQYQICNYSDRPVYLVLLGLDSGANGFAFYPFTASADRSEAEALLKNEQIAPGKTLTLPHVSNSFEWIIHGPTGLTTVYLILSRQPFNQTLTTLETVARQIGDVQQVAALPDLLEVAHGVLQDLHQASAMGKARIKTIAAQVTEIPEESLALDVNAWATLRFTYRVV
jgi:hypothetical protein